MAGPAAHLHKTQVHGCCIEAVLAPVQGFGERPARALVGSSDGCLWVTDGYEDPLPFSCSLEGQPNRRVKKMAATDQVVAIGLQHATIGIVRMDTLVGQ
jgi:hypothetical protein